MDLKKLFREHPSYLDNGIGYLAKKFNTTIEEIKRAKESVKKEGISYERKSNTIKSTKDINTLIISDLHMPFNHKKALDFCIKLRDKWNCKRIISTGDLIDNHFSSFHDISTKAKGADEELKLVKKVLKPWYKEFPEMYICTGNHDAIVTRKTEYANLSKEWLRPINEVLEIPNWKFKDKWEFDNFVVIHGTDGKNIKNKLFKYGGNKSIIQAHFHSSTSLEYYNNNIFGLQLGALIDKDAYAFEYAKNTSNLTILSAAIIINGVPIIETMKE